MTPSTTRATGSFAEAHVRWRPVALAALLYAALTVAQSWPLILHLPSAVPHDLGDPLMSTAILWWSAHVLPFTERWWDGFAFFPAHGSLALSDPRVGEALIAAPLQWLGCSPVTAYNLTFLTTYLLSALAAHWLVFVLTRSHDAATLAGIAYGFCPFRSAHLSHLELLAGYGMPAALAALHTFVNTRRRKWLVVFALALVVQGLSSSYYLLFFSVLLALWLLWFMRAEDARMLVEVGLAGAAAGVLLLPQAIGMSRILALHGLTRSLNEIVFYSADATTLAGGDSSLRFWGWTSRFGTREGFGFPGVVVPMLVLAWGFIAWRRDWARDRLDRLAWWLLAPAAIALMVAGAGWAFAPWHVEVPGLRMSSDAPYKPLTVAVVLLALALASASPLRRAYRERSAFALYTLASLFLFICSFGPRPTFAGHQFLYRPPYQWLMSLPVFDAVRVPARFTMPAMLALVVAAALAFDRLRPAHMRRVFAAVLIAAVATDGWLGAMPLAAVPDTWPASRAEGFAAVVELPFGDLFGDLAAMYRATTHGRPVVNGTSGFEPGYYSAVRSALTEFDPVGLEWLSVSGRVLFVLDRHVSDAADWNRFLSSYPRVTRLPSDDRWAFYAFDPAPAPAETCAGPSARLRAVNDADGPVDLRALSDGDPNTWWRTPHLQQEGDSLTIQLADALTPCALVLGVGRLYPTYPRSLVVESSVDGVDWTRVAHVRTASLAIRAALSNPVQTRFAIPLVPRPATQLRLTLNQNNPGYPWHVTELAVTQSAESHAADAAR